MTAQEAIAAGIAQLSHLYDESEATAITRLLLEHISTTAKPVNFSQRNKTLESAQVARFTTLLSQLATAEPLQYVLHEAWFCGLKFYVDHQVLIPRPETEELVEWIVAECKFPVDTLNILDIGTGSGCIPITLKRRLRKATITACDISADAIEVAKTNAASLGAHIQFECLDFLQQSNQDKLDRFDIIVSNPPYIPEKDKASMHANVVDFEPHKALFVPDNDPLLFYKATANFAATHLLPGGKVYMEIYENERAGVAAVFEASGFNIDLKKDMQGKDRMIRASL